ncbi:MAG: MFS transporter [Deltaproteobacteria bacterium]
MNYSLQTTTRAFRHKNYRLYWLGQLLSLVGTWMQNMAQGWLVLTLTNSAFAVGVVNAAQFTPILLLSLYAGVVADRCNKKRLLLITQTSMLLLTGIMGVLTLTGTVAYWQIVLLASLLGLANTFDVPARQSFVVEMVGKEDLPNAIAQNSLIFNLARIIGPALAGLIIAHFGAGMCFVINSFSFMAVLTSLVLIRPLSLGQIKPDIGHPWQNIREGLDYTRKTPIVAYCITLMAGLSLFAINFSVLIPVLARNTFHQNAVGYGYLMTATGIGALCGALSMAALSDLTSRKRILKIAAFGLCFFQILLGFDQHYFDLALPLLFLIGLSMVLFATSVNTTLQLNVPDHLRGRIMSLYNLVFAGVTPFGALLSGAISHRLGAGMAFSIGAVLGLVCLLFVNRTIMTDRSQVPN